MNKTVLAVSFACALGLAAAGLRADAPSADTVTLKDGRVVHGQVVEESASKVVVLVDGARRSYNRDYIRRIVYGPGPADDAAGPDASASAPAAPKGDLVAELAARYRVPERDVLWVRNQGIADADLPLVFLIAATARVTPRSVVQLRLKGRSWADIEDHFGMDSQYIYYEAGPWGPYPYYWYPGWWGLGWGWGWGHGYWGGGWGGHFGGRWR